MVLPLLAKGIMGASKVASGAKMAKNIFKRKGGKDAPDVPASEQTIDVKATTVQPTTSLVPNINPIDATGISKATSPTGTEDLEGTAFRIKTTLVDVDTLLRGSFALDKIREDERKKKESEKAKQDQEKELESATKKNGKKFGLGKLVPKKAKSIFGYIINFFVTLLLGKILMSLLDNIGAFERIAKVVGAIANFIIEWGGKLFNALVSFIDFSYSIFDKLRGTVGDLFGEEGLKVFDSITGAMKNVINGVITLTLAMIAFSGEFGSSLMEWGKGFMSIFKRGLVRAVPRLLIKILGKKTAGTILTKLGIKAATTATTAATTTAATTATATTATTATAATGGTAATVGGVSAGVAAGAVAAAGALAVGLGEGIFALGKKGYAVEEDWRKKADEKWWTDPRKYWWGIGAGMLGITNRAWSFLGGIFDIIGAPFRMLGELIMFPFLSEEGKRKQRDNLVKYDTRIREQFRKFTNMFDIFGMVSDDEGSWGSIYGKAASEKASKEMGFEKKKIKTNTKTETTTSSDSIKYDVKGGKVRRMGTQDTILSHGNSEQQYLKEQIRKLQLKIRTKKKRYGDDSDTSAMEEKLEGYKQRYNKTVEYGGYEIKSDKKSPNISSESKSYNGIETYPSYDEAGGGTTTYIVSHKGSSSGGGETSSATNAETVKLSEGLMLSNAGSGDSSNPYDVLAKR